MLILACPSVLSQIKSNLHKCVCLVPLIAVSEVHSSMGKAVKMFCSGDWDPKRVPQGTECLEPLLEGAPSHLPSRPQRCFTGNKRSVHLSQPEVVVVSRDHLILVFFCGAVTTSRSFWQTFNTYCNQSHKSNFKK